MKVVVSDIDANMDLSNNSDLLVSIRNFIRKGNLFIVASDKAINYIADTLAMINIEPEYYICNDGAVIFDRYYNILYRKDLNQSVVTPIMNMLTEDDNILEAFIDTSHGFVHTSDKNANGIVARPYDFAKALETLNRIVLKFPSVHGHVNENWLNIIDIEVNKGKALAFLETTYNLNKEDIYVIGEGNNDLSMFERYNGYTTKNSCEDLKSLAKGEVKDLRELLEKLMEEVVIDEEFTIYENI